jgi:glutamine synthetase
MHFKEIEKLLASDGKVQFSDIQKIIEEHEIEFIDFRFSDTLGKEHHVSVPSHQFTQSLVDYGHPFDGSSIAGWQGIECSDMLLKLDLSTVKMDPFYEHNTLFITCDVYDPISLTPYIKCPRGIARKAEKFLIDSGIGSTAFFGPEPEFFIFDSITWGRDMSGCHVKIESEESGWSSSEKFDGGNMGHRPTAKNGYFPLPPVDSLHDIRAQMVCVLEELGIPTEIHHHEVATAGQCEIGTKFSTLVTRGDWSQTFRYVVHNVAHRYGKTATFMPKPIVGDNGSGMHVHQSIWKDGKNLFAGNGYAGLSQTALYYIGGIIKHAKALNAITNPSTNSYKRLVPGYEAPVILAYAARNRSASIRIPVTQGEAAKRIEVRFPDAMANPYLAYSAMMMAGIDGIINKIDPGAASDKNLYELSKEELANIPQVCGSLEEALHNLDQDRDFLKRGNVFSDEWIDAFIELKQAEVDKYRMTSHPIEYEMYYSL